MPKFNNDKEKVKNLYQLWHLTHRKIASYVLNNSHFSLSIPQIIFMQILELGGNSTPSKIAKKMGVTYGAITSLTDRLVKEELIFRKRSEADRRVVDIGLTEKGKKIVTEVEEERTNLAMRFFKQLSEEDITVLIKIYCELDKIVDSELIQL